VQQGGGHFATNTYADTIAFNEFTPRWPQPGNPGIFVRCGSNWVDTEICNTRRGSDKKEWINFDTVLTETSESFPDRYDPFDAN